MRTSLLIVSLAVLVTLGSPPAAAQKKDWYERAVKKVEATFEPAEAKPGDTVTLRLTVHLNEGFHTYPTRQPDKAAEAMVNTIKFPDPGAVEFVGDVTDPKDFKTKAEPELGIKEVGMV
jgi:DsbC/DsbD-like thiol-disulfide interchange protein